MSSTRAGRRRFRNGGVASSSLAVGIPAAIDQAPSSTRAVEPSLTKQATSLPSILIDTRVRAIRARGPELSATSANGYPQASAVHMREHVIVFVKRCNFLRRGAW